MMSLEGLVETVHMDGQVPTAISVSMKGKKGKDRIPLILKLSPGIFIFWEV